MKHEDIETLVSDVVETIIADSELELVDVEYVRERDWYLRVYLDKVGGLDLDDCQMVSEKLSEFLDTKDPIKENYLLEVSSPGLDRVLKKDKDLLRYHGRVVDVQFFKSLDGDKKITGKLGAFTADTVDIIVDEVVRTLDRKVIAQIRLHLDF